MSGGQVTDSSKEPSKGAMRAAQATLNIIDERITFFAYEKEKPKSLEIVAEVIDRETKAGEMAVMLREAERIFGLIGQFTGGDLTIVEHWRENLGRLLTDLYPNEEKGPPVEALLPARRD